MVIFTCAPGRMWLPNFYGPSHEPNTAHDVVAVLYSENLPYLFGYCDAPASNNFSKERDVFFVDLNRQDNLDQDSEQRDIMF